MFNHYYGYPALIPNATQQRIKLGDPIDGEANGRLIQQQHARFANQRTRDLNDPLLSKR